MFCLSVDPYTICVPGAVETRIGTKKFSNFLRSLEDTLGDYCILDFRLLGTPPNLLPSETTSSVKHLKIKISLYFRSISTGGPKVPSLFMCTACYRTGAAG